MSNVLAVTDETFQTEVLDSNLPVIIDFWATWCGPCQQMAPVFAQVAQELEDRAKFVKVDVDASPATARRYGIKSIPTFVIVRDGELSQQFSGSRPQAALKAEIEAALA